MSSTRRDQHERHGRKTFKARHLGTKKREKFSRTTSENILEETSRVERLLKEYDSCWTEIGCPSAKFLFESSRTLNEKKRP
jgi:hypothetical protein